MQALQLLNHISHILHTRSQPPTDLLLRLLIHIQEAFDELAIDEAEWFCGLSLGVLEGAVGVEVHVTERLDDAAHTVLQVHEDALGAGGYGGEEVD